MARRAPDTVSLRRTCQMQSALGFRDDRKKLQVLFVDKTARGKSHDMRLLATINKGVHVYVCPLLVLMADIVLKFQEGN